MYSMKKQAYLKLLKFFRDKVLTIDRYILRQIIELFILGVFVFTSIIFASDTFISLIKQISN